MSEFSRIGFIGLGVMGEPICRNLAEKSGLAVAAFDLQDAPRARLQAHGVERSDSPQTLAAAVDVVFLCLPSGKYVEALCEGEGGLLALARPGQCVVDLGTSPLALARYFAAAFAA